MDNSTIADNFSLLSKLIDINGGDSFKSKTYSIAAYNIEKLPMQLKDAESNELFNIKGIGKSIGQKVTELLETGSLSAINEYLEQTPAGIIEMMQIKGLGPKKIHSIWKDMHIESIGELLYACNENRLLLYKGFGAKSQQSIQEAIEYYLLNQGNFLYAQIDAVFPQIEAYLQKLFGKDKVVATGDYIRQMNTLHELEFVVNATNEQVKPQFLTAYPPELLEETPESLCYKLSNGLRLKLYTGTASLPYRQLKYNGSTAFNEAFAARFPGISFPGIIGNNDAAIFEKAGISYIPPCLRETANNTIFDKAASGQLPQLITAADIKGIIHSHSTWSDGSNSIEEMVKACIQQGFEYLVLSDHSKTAFYAQGLTIDRVLAQHAEIERLNTLYAPFKIFKSIESDILNDGSLDYEPDVLQLFDLVIASVHSNLGMTEEKAMARLLKAIENPYTTILGHPTGRLLLSRKGYPLQMEKITDACIANKVVIELNAHPRRLDIDWQYIAAATEKGALISIDPDAHSTEGFADIKYGVIAAQKGGLTAAHNLSSFTLPQMNDYLLQLKTEKL